MPAETSSSLSPGSKGRLHTPNTELSDTGTFYRGVNTYSVICKPGMVETLLCTEPLFGAQYQQRGDEIFGVIRNFVKIWHLKGVLAFQRPGHGPVPG